MLAPSKAEEQGHEMGINLVDMILRSEKNNEPLPEAVAA
jgi:hypothetical protein